MEFGDHTIVNFTNGEHVWRKINDRPEAYRLTGPEADAARFLDFQPMQTLKVPFRAQILVDGELKQDTQVDQREIHIGVFDAYFDVPGMAGDWPPWQAAN